MKIKVIGCSGSEFPGHNTPAFLLDKEILLDAGSFTSVLNEREQMRIRNIFITHAHLDHIRSIPFFADNIIVGKKKHNITIYSIPPVIKIIKRHLFNSAVWPDFTLIPNPDHATLNFRDMKTGFSSEINSYTITPYRVKHTVPAVGYLVEDRKGRLLFYSGDTGPMSETWRKIGTKKIHCLIIDVSFPDSMHTMALTTGHLTPRLLKREIAKLRNKPEMICITHIKPHYYRTIKRELEHLQIENLKIFHDGDTIVV
jgi:cAMP phosphodiesterase